MLRTDAPPECPEAAVELRTPGIRLLPPGSNDANAYFVIRPACEFRPLIFRTYYYLACEYYIDQPEPAAGVRSAPGGTQRQPGGGAHRLKPACHKQCTRPPPGDFLRSALYAHLPWHDADRSSLGIGGTG